MGIIVLISIFLILREFVCWYYKINERIAIQIKFNELLEQLIQKNNEELELNSFRINELEIYNNDILIEKKWNDALKSCEQLGDGWRLPTKEELNTIFQNKESIKNLKDKGYWSSTEDEFNYAWGQGFKDGLQKTAKKELKLNVRPVRNIR